MTNLTIQQMYDYAMLSTASYIRAGIKHIHEDGEESFQEFQGFPRPWNSYKEGYITSRGK